MAGFSPYASMKCISVTMSTTRDSCTSNSGQRCALFNTPRTSRCTSLVIVMAILAKHVLTCALANAGKPHSPEDALGMHTSICGTVVAWLLEERTFRKPYSVRATKATGMVEMKQPAMGMKEQMKTKSDSRPRPGIARAHIPAAVRVVLTIAIWACTRHTSCVVPDRGSLRVRS